MIEFDLPRQVGKTTQIIKNAIKLSLTQKIVIVCRNDCNKKYIESKIGHNKNIKVISQREKLVGHKVDLVLCDEATYISDANTIRLFTSNKSVEVFASE